MYYFFINKIQNLLENLNRVKKNYKDYKRLFENYLKRIKNSIFTTGPRKLLKYYIRQERKWQKASYEKLIEELTDGKIRLILREQKQQFQIVSNKANY